MVKIDKHNQIVKLMIFLFYHGVFSFNLKIFKYK